MAAQPAIVTLACLLALAPLCQASSGVFPPWYPYNSSTWATSVWHHSELCKDGKLQSPIDLPRCAEPASRPATDITWATQNVSLINNGHTVQLNFEAEEPGQMIVGGSTYTLVQCHFHHGSEHRVGSEQYPMEAHCVHSKDGSPGHFAVFALFFQVGAASPLVAQFVDDLPLPPTDPSPEAETVSDFTGPLDVRELYGNISLRHYWDYRGSLTTPPCSETVEWFVMMETVTLSQAQLAAMDAALGWNEEHGDSRPPEPLNHRKVGGCAPAPAQARGTKAPMLRAAPVAEEGVATSAGFVGRAWSTWVAWVMPVALYVAVSH